MRHLDVFDRNHLLGSLLEGGCEGLLSHLKLVQLNFGDVLYEAESKFVYAYFPTTSLVSLLSTMEDGASDETAFVGSEGIVGVSLLLGAETTPHRAVVRSAGSAFRLSAQVLMEEFNRSTAMQNLLLRYTQALLTQVSRNLACHRHHSIHQRFSRWLLSSIDRLPSNELCLTHESIAGMLGVRRETITKEGRELQAAGLIQNGRGRIVVIDRPNLEARACECYWEENREFRRLRSAATAFCRPDSRGADRYVRLPPAIARTHIASAAA